MSHGMMNPSNFVSKGELLRWLNDFFQINYTRVEEACTGAIHCQILDAIFPGKVALSKVNFNATQEYQFVNNYKVLQSVFNSQKIGKHVEVQRLIKGRYQDNLELLQWMKHFFETRYNGQEYDPVARREMAIKRFGASHKHTGRARTEKKSSSTTSSRTATTRPAKRTGTRKAPAAQDAPNAEEVAQLHLTLEGLAQERSFYYNKLREVELMLNGLKEADPAPSEEVTQLCDDVLKILYKEDDDFTAPEEEGAAEE